MSDSITNCVVYKNLDGSVQSYNVTFSFDGVVVPSSVSAIFVGSSTMSNPSDLTEAKELACQQASAVKALYSTATSITTLNGPVSL
jgi:hypothetical protein